MGLLVDGQPDDAVHSQDLLTQLHSMFDGFVPFVGHFYEPLLRVFEERDLGLFPRQLLLQLLVLLDQEMEGILQVLVAVDEHFVILVQIVDQVLHEEQVVRIEGRKLDGSEISSRSLSLLVRRVDQFLLCHAERRQLFFLGLISLAVRALGGHPRRALILQANVVIAAPSPVRATAECTRRRLIVSDVRGSKRCLSAHGHLRSAQS